MTQPIDRIFESVQWELCDPPNDTSDGLPYATHAGVLKIGDIEFECAILNTGQRIFTGKAIEDLIEGLFEQP